ALLGLLLGADDVGGRRTGVPRRLGADRGAELGRATDPRLRDPALLLLGLGTLLARAPREVVAKDLYAPALAIALARLAVAPLRSLAVSLVLHRPRSFSILARERSLPRHPAGWLREGV